MKNDINLLYKRKVKSYSNKNISVLLLIIVLIGALAYAGIALPSGNLQAAKKKAAEVSKQLASSTVDQQDLTKKAELKAELDLQLSELNVLKDSKAVILDYIEVIERSRPSKITVQQMSTDTAGTINLLGIADSDKTIALFCLRLREQNKFKRVFLSSSLNSPDDGTESFVIKITLPSTLDSATIIKDLEQKNDKASKTASGGK